MIKRSVGIFIAIVLIAGCGSRVSSNESGVDVTRVMEDLTTLASDTFEGRQAGLPGSEMAVEMAVKRFEKLGLKPPAGRANFLQNFPMTAWEQTTPTIFNISGQPLTEGMDYMLLMYSDSASVTGELVFAGYGMTVPAFDPNAFPGCPLDSNGYDDYSGVDADGKIVIIVYGAQNGNSAIGEKCPSNINSSTGIKMRPDSRSYKMKNAVLHGAKAIILIDGYWTANHVLMFGYSEHDEANLATLIADRNKIGSFLPDLQTWCQGIDNTLKPAGKMTGLIATFEAGSYRFKNSASNVIGIIPGTDPRLRDEVIIISGHLDHMGERPNGDIYPGADDDASGMAVMLELARAASTGLSKPARTLVFAAFNAEEIGLIGSCYYVNQEPLYPVKSTKAMISVDMVGLGNGNGLELWGASDKDKKWLAKTMSGSAAALGMDYKVSAMEPIMASDHACFAEAGVAAVLAESAADADHTTYHTPGDTVEKINVNALEASLRLMWALLVPLAMGTEDSYQNSEVVMKKGDFSSTRRDMKGVDLIK